MQLPSKLIKEPLVDVVFEVRFTANMPMSSVFPGLLFGKLQGIGQIEPGVGSFVPDQVKALNPQLAYAASSRVHWENFVILIGDRSIGVGCKMPYPGWQAFRSGIDQVLRVLQNSNLVTSFERYSLKYIDFFATGADHLEALKRINISLRIGRHEVAAENTVVRVEIPRSPFVHAVQVASCATLNTSDGTERVGAIVDVDTWCDVKQNPEGFFDSLIPSLDALHTSNKEMFFECLSEYGLKLLEPQYA